METKKNSFLPNFVIGNSYSITLTGVHTGLKHLNNRLNPKMNNIMAIDYSGSDWQKDTDYVVPRQSMEFPRLANNFQTKSPNQ